MALEVDIDRQAQVRRRGGRVAVIEDTLVERRQERPGLVSLWSER